MAKRGPKPTPLHILNIHGSWRGNLKGGSQTEEGSLPIEGKNPRMPSWLSPEAKNEWRRIAKIMKSRGTFDEMSRSLIAGYCQLWADYLQALKYCEKGILYRNTKGDTVQNPAVIIKNNAFKLLLKTAATLGIPMDVRFAKRAQVISAEELRKQRFFCKSGKKPKLAKRPKKSKKQQRNKSSA